MTPETCWFCGKPVENEARYAQAVMTRDHKSRASGSAVVKSWKQDKISVPRCIKCGEIHGRVDSFSWAGGMIGFLLPYGLLAFAIFMAATGDGDFKFSSFIPGFVFAFIASILLAWWASKAGRIFGNLLLTKGSKPEPYKGKHPNVQTAKLEGWKFSG